jgi:mycoredoxin
MRQFMQASGIALGIVFCFVLGFYGVRYFKAADKTSEPAIVQGDFSAHLQNYRVQVVLYGTASCKFCQSAREYLKQKEIAFADARVDADPAARKAFETLKRRSVPQIIIGDQLIGGFNQQMIDTALKQIGTASPEGAPNSVAQTN